MRCHTRTARHGFPRLKDRVHEQLAGEGLADLRPVPWIGFRYLPTHPGATAVGLGEHWGIRSVNGKTIDQPWAR